MPIPLIPAILLGGSAIMSAIGVKKGVDAVNNFKKAEEIGEQAQRRHKKALDRLESDRSNTQSSLESLGELKISVFENQIQYLVDAIKKARSELKDFNIEISTEQLEEYERSTKIGSPEVGEGLASGAAGGALAAIGAYGTVGMLATATTGTAISSLSGAAATNATLAWLGGGSLAAGGLGVAGGTIALAGIALGPALTIGGFIVADKAEKAVTKALEYKAEVDVAIAEINKVSTGLAAIRSNVEEQKKVILRLVDYFEKVKVREHTLFEKSKRLFLSRKTRHAKDELAFQRMVTVGKALKEVLDIKILDQEEGKAIEGLDVTYSGYLQIIGPEVENASNS